METTQCSTLLQFKFKYSDFYICLDLTWTIFRYFHHISNSLSSRPKPRPNPNFTSLAQNCTVITAKEAPNRKQVWNPERKCKKGSRYSPVGGFAQRLTAGFPCVEPRISLAVALLSFCAVAYHRRSLRCYAYRLNLTLSRAIWRARQLMCSLILKLPPRIRRIFDAPGSV